MDLHFRVWPASKEDVLFGSILSIFAINTWLFPYVNLGANGSSWTICTLFFWYWCFPFILPRLQRLTDKELAHGIVKYFWLSVGLAFLLNIGLGGFTGTQEVSNFIFIKSPM